MNRSRSFAAGAALLAVAGGGAAVAVSASGQTTAPPTGQLVVNLNNNGAIKYVDNRPKKKPSGDLLFGSGKATTGDGTKGKFDFQLLFGTRTAQASGVLRLPAGEIHISELFPLAGDPKVNVGIIEGGTGAYAGARGDLKDEDVGGSNSDKSKLTLTFVP
jgi:hypothetical protein